jgi:hypothetical protein
LKWTDSLSKREAPAACRKVDHASNEDPAGLELEEQRSIRNSASRIAVVPPLSKRSIVDVQISANLICGQCNPEIMRFDIGWNRCDQRYYAAPKRHSTAEIIRLPDEDVDDIPEMMCGLRGQYTIKRDV